MKKPEDSKGQIDSDDGFGDFGDFEGAQNEENKGQKAGGEKEDDQMMWGNFESNATASAWTEAKATAAEEDGFGDFGEFQEEKNEQPSADDGFGDFGDFEEAGKDQHVESAPKDTPTGLPEAPKSTEVKEIKLFGDPFQSLIE